VNRTDYMLGKTVERPSPTIIKGQIWLRNDRKPFDPLYLTIDKYMPPGVDEPHDRTSWTISVHYPIEGDDSRITTMMHPELLDMLKAYSTSPDMNNPCKTCGNTIPGIMPCNHPQQVPQQVPGEQQAWEERWFEGAREARRGTQNEV